MINPQEEINYFSNPKRKTTNNTVKNQWYDYYAGYSELFVEDVLNYLKLQRDAVVFDPWNGSGTTTYIAEKKGYNSIGFDINPVMSIIASARRLVDYKDIIIDLQAIIKRSKRYTSSYIPSNDPLLNWLSEDSVVSIRRLERSIQKVILERNSFMYASKPNVFNRLLNTPEAAFYYVALFKTLKDILKTFKTSNPTWIKKPIEESKKINIRSNEIYSCFETHVNTIIETRDTKGKKKDESNVLLGVASSTNLPLHDAQVDAVITSPPYCTRIDYAIATRLELAVMGLGNDINFQDLRSNMIGTIKIVKGDYSVNTLWGETACDFISKVRNHYSKASKTYYVKQYLQYFKSIFQSLKELNRITKGSGHIIIVVQDSYYKDIHLDLAKIYSEMSLHFDWYLKHVESFYQAQTIGGINKHKYRKKSSATEHVLVFKKEN